MSPCKRTDEPFATTAVENDREADAIVDRVWYYEQDPNHLMGYDLSNSWGLNTDVHQKTFSLPVNSFSKPGTYTVRYRVQEQQLNSHYWNEPDTGRRWSQWAEMKVHVYRRPMTVHGPGGQEGDPVLAVAVPGKWRGVDNFLGAPGSFHQSGKR